MRVPVVLLGMSENFTAPEGINGKAPNPISRFGTVELRNLRDYPPFIIVPVAVLRE
jgi:hypothetical protein